MSTSPGPNLFNQLVSRQINSKIGCVFPSLIFRERLKIAKNLYKTDLVGHYGCVNAIEFSNGGKYLASGGDDKRVLLWDVEKSLAGYAPPISMDKEHQSNIFCLGFDKTNSKVFSGGNDELVIVHDFETKKVVDVFIHQKPVYGLSVDPTCDSILATASEDGKITIYDQRKSAAVQIFGKFGGSRQASFHAVQFHPLDGNFLVTANTRKGAAIWDIRSTSKPLIQYGGEENQKSCMSVRFNSNGTLVLALRRRLPPILYNTTSDTPICQFYHPDYYNSCTMKSCCFAGEDDEFVLSGSDDFNLYVWRVGDIDLDQSHQWIEKTQMILYGHRSIVNQVRYNAEKCILASSGVEKIVKIWSPFQQKSWGGSLIDEVTCSDNPREVFTHDAYLSLANANMSHDYSTQNTQEDSRMMAFFDSLIQQEIEQWNTTNYSSDSCQFSNDSSDARSTRHSSTDDSDENENMNNFFTNSRNRNRRGNPTSIKPQRNKYTNRIAYLIATKRNTLRRLALKGASNSRRRQNIIKTKKKIHHRNSSNHGIRTSRSGNSQKRTGRYMSSMSFRNRTGSANNNISDNSELKSIRQKRYDAVFRALRRKHRSRRHIDPSDTSSDDDDDVDVSFNYEPSRSTNIAIPSTSTGITSSGRDIIIRLRQQEQLLDSEYYDDDDDEETTSTTNRNSNANSIVQNNVNNNNVNNNHNNVQNVILNGRTNYNNNNSINNHSMHVENTYRNSSYESDNSSSNEETDPEIREDNHSNNNSDMVNNTVLVTENLVTDSLVTASNIDNNITDEIEYNNINTNNNIIINNKVSRKRIAPDLSILGEASSSSSFTANCSNTNSNNNSIKNIDSNNFTNSSNRNLDIYSSHSNSRLSNSDYLEDDSNSLSNESLDCFISNNNSNSDYTSTVGFKKRRKISSIGGEVDTSQSQFNSNNNDNINVKIYHKQVDQEGDNEEEYNIDNNNVACSKNYYNSYKNNKINNKNNNRVEENRTPKNCNKFNGFSKTFIPVTPDSGVNTTAGCSSVTSASPGSAGHNNNNNNEDDNLNLMNNNKNNNNSDKFSIKLFHQKIARVRRNYRNKFGDDSESD